MRVSCRVHLWLEERIEVPEAGLYEIVCGHFLEAHLQEDFAELRAHLEQRMQVASGWGHAQRFEIVFLHFHSTPRARREQLLAQVDQLLLSLQGEFLSLTNNEIPRLRRRVTHTYTYTHTYIHTHTRTYREKVRERVSFR